MTGFKQGITLMNEEDDRSLFCDPLRTMGKETPSITSHSVKLQEARSEKNVENLAHAVFSMQWNYLSSDGLRLLDCTVRRILLSRQ